MILLTAFNPFGSADTNASEMLLNALEDEYSVVRVVLRTEYEAGGGEIVRLIRNLRPEIVICFGVSEQETTIRLERVAKNWDGTLAPDNARESRSGQAIFREGPDYYLATLPYDAMAVALRDRGISYVFSDDAGGYVCNHVFFCALHEIAMSESPTLCGFVHVPPIRDHAEFSMLLGAIRVCIEAAANATR
jgi:pyroglutamyl-peptidase